MRIQPTQSTNFGAIKIKGLDLASKEGNDLYIHALHIQKPTKRGMVKEGMSNTYNNYFQTIEGSEKELSLIAYLKKMFAHKTEIKVESCPDLEAKEAIDNFGKK